MSVRILIVEDEREIREEYRMLIKNRSMLQLSAAVDNYEDAIQVLEATSIDALILDLELPRGSGIFLLEKMQSMQITKPFIAVVTNVVSKVIYDTIRNMGVDYICAKGDSGFSLDVPLTIIEICAPYRTAREQAKSVTGKVNKRTMEAVYRRTIEEELSGLGFSNKMLGTNYCREAILFILMSESMEVSMTKEVYPHVASKFHTNINNVERNIRLAIEKVWTEQDIRWLKQLYPYEWNVETGRPTNAEFFYNIIKKILRR